jgi:hypothetical protein
MNSYPGSGVAVTADPEVPISIFCDGFPEIDPCKSDP